MKNKAISENKNSCTNKQRENSVAFWERGSWYHRTKELLENGKTKYGKKVIGNAWMSTMKM